MTYITEHKEEFGVETMCRLLQLAPSTFYEASIRPPSPRAQHDIHLKEAIEFVWDENYGVTVQTNSGHNSTGMAFPVARCTVERLMQDLGISGVVRGKTDRTTITDDAALRPANLVDPIFVADAPNRLWVADLTYVKSHSGWVYVAFIVDVFSRYIVGWQASRSLRSDLALDALEMAMWARRGEQLDGLIHHSERGVQYLSIRYTERLAEAGAVRSVGSRGDS